MPAPSAAQRCRRLPPPGTIPWPAPHRLESRPSPRSAPRSARPPCRSCGSSVGTVGVYLVEKMQVSHHASELLANVVELSEARRRLHRLLQRLKWIAAIGAG